MDNSVYVALSRQLSQFRMLDITANNVANANTTGYQAEKVLFTDYLVDAEAQGNKNIAFTQDIATYRDTSTGRLEQTSNALDVAIQGPAYFGVETQNGLQYTKAGNFKINNEGILVTMEGLPIRGAQGGNIVFEDVDSDVVIGQNGLVTVLGVDRSAPREERGTIGMFTIPNPQNMQREGNMLLSTDQAGEALELEATNGLGRLDDQSVMVQGFLEQSNVSPVSEMVRLTKLQRGVGSTAKFIEVVYDLQRKTSNTYTKNN